MKGKGALYLFKGLRIILLWFATTIGARLFESEYIEKVYGRGERPPDLTMLLSWIVAAVMVFNTLLIAGMTLLSSEFSSGSVVFSRKYISIVAVDGFVHAGVLVFMGFLVTSTVQQKKYFAYRTEGARAIRATKELIMAVAVPFLMLPYFIKT